MNASRSEAGPLTLNGQSLVLDKCRSPDGENPRILRVGEKGAEMANLNLKALSAPIEALRPEVDAAYKRLDAKWKAVTDHLGKLPIPTKIGCRIDESDDGNWELCFEWRKWKGARRLCIVSYHLPTDETDVTPYEEWSGEQRVEILKHVPALFAAAEKGIKEFIEQTKEE